MVVPDSTPSFFVNNQLVSLLSVSVQFILFAQYSSAKQLGSKLVLHCFHKYIYRAAISPSLIYHVDTNNKIIVIDFIFLFIFVV